MIWVVYSLILVKGNAKDLAQSSMFPTCRGVRNLYLKVGPHSLWPSRPRHYIPPRFSSADVSRSGGFLVLCSSDSALEHFKDDAAYIGLTDEGVSECAVSVVKGFSDDEAVVGAGLMLIFVFGGSAGEWVAASVGVVVSELCCMPPSSTFGFAGPDSFSMRRFRIYRATSLAYERLILSKWEHTCSIFSLSGASGGGGGCWSLSMIATM